MPPIAAIPRVGRAISPGRNRASTDALPEIVTSTGGGVNAERGHANIQGNTDNAISWEIFPGYLAVPKPGMNTMADYIAKVPSKPTSPNAVNYFGTNYKKFLVSTLKAFYGDAAKADNDFAYSWLPKPAQNSSWLTVHDEARSGRLTTVTFALEFRNTMNGLKIVA